MKKAINKYKNLPIPVKAGIWFMICSIIQRGIALITVPIFTRLLSVEEYGLYSTYVSWESIVLILITLRLDYTVFNKGMSKYKNNRDGYIASMQLVTTFTTIMMLIIYLLFQNNINRITELDFFLMILMIFQAGFAPSLSFWMIKKRYEYDYKKFVFISLSMGFINTIIGIMSVLFINGDGGVVRIISYALVDILFSLVLYFINFKNGFKNYKIDHIKYALLFNIPMIPHYFSTYILNHSDRIMIQKMTNKVNVGIYNVSYNAGMLMTIVSTSIINAYTPWYYEKFDDNKQEDVSNLFLPLMICIILPIFAFMLFAPEALKLLASENFYDALYIIPPVSASIIFIFMYSYFSIAEFYYDKNKFSAIISTIAALVNIVTNYIFIRLFDYRAAGYTTLLSYFILSLGHYLYGNHIVKKHIENDYVKWTLFLSISLIVFSYVAIVCFLYNYLLLRYILAIVILLSIALKRREIIILLKDVKSTHPKKKREVL